MFCNHSKILQAKWVFEDGRYYATYSRRFSYTIPGEKIKIVDENLNFIKYDWSEPKEVEEIEQVNSGSDFEQLYTAIDISVCWKLIDYDITLNHLPFIRNKEMNVATAPACNEGYYNGIKSFIFFKETGVNKISWFPQVNNWAEINLLYNGRQQWYNYGSYLDNDFTYYVASYGGNWRTKFYHTMKMEDVLNIDYSIIEKTSEHNKNLLRKYFKHYNLKTVWENKESYMIDRLNNAEQYLNNLESNIKYN